MIAGTMRSTTPIDWSEYGLWEYLLVAHPDKEVRDKVVEEKRHFTKTYNERSAIKTHPYITIANFLGNEQMEGTLSRWIRNICNSHSSFNVTLNNFSGFVPHTIFLQIDNAQPFKQLAASLKVLDHFIQANDCPPLKLVTTPHLTIARRLPEQVYFRALKDYMQRSFQQSFAVNSLTLIKRSGEYATCQTVQVFALPSEQGTLFN
jgi:2'-5' RNA ligase